MPVMHGISSQHAGVQPPHPECMSHLRLVALTVGLAGLQFCWAIQIGYVTRTLLQLHLSPQFVSLAWLAGPIAGIVVQPIVGVLSDACTSSLGRRRPFLIGGSLVTMLSIASFAYATDIAAVLHVPPLVIAVLAFWVLDFALNAAQGPLRALMADVAPSHQQQVGNAYFAFMTGFGNFMGNLFGSIPLASYLPFFKENVHALYVLAIVVLGVTMSITVVVTREVPLVKADRNSARERDGYQNLLPMVAAEEHATASERMSDEGLVSSIASSVKFIRAAPFPFRDLFVMQCFTWFSWFTIFIFGTSWVGAEVYNGAADAAPGSAPRVLYEDGVRAGNFGLAMQALVATFFALSLPRLVARSSPRAVLLASHAFLGVALLCTVLLTDVSLSAAAQLLLASTGLPWAITMTVPWAVVSEAVLRERPESAGRYLTIFNLSQCLPEVAVSVVSTAVEARTHRQSSMLALGGAFAFFGAAYILLFSVGSRVETPEGESR